ncbi:MAG: hypothetical protein QXE75_05395 [Sulfolobales archaeon]
MSAYKSRNALMNGVGSIKRAQSTVLTEVLMASAALVIGMSILAYFSSFTTSYTRQVELANLVNYEAANQVVRLIAYDSTSKSVWLLLRRLDGTPRNFLLMLDVDGDFLNCRSVYVYVEPSDENGIVCDGSDGDCVSSCFYYDRYVSSKEVLVWTKDGLIPLYDFLKRQSPQQVGLIRIPYPNPAAGYRTQNTIIRVDLDKPAPETARVYLGIEHDGRIYVVRVYEVSLS